MNKIKSPIIPFYKEDKNKKAFTLVELIVVITILAILATVGFVSFSGYLAGTRDVNRIAQLKSMSYALELYRTKKDLPIPDDKIDIKSGSDVIAYQGYIGKNVLETIEYTESGLDPKDKTYFSYYLTKDKKYFQLLAFLEEENDDFTIDYSERNPHTQGKKLGILTDKDNKPIQEIQNGSINTSDVGTLELKSFLKGDEYITGTGTTFAKLKKVALNGGKYWQVKNNVFLNLDPDDDWKIIDPNCDLSNIIIGSQIWAGCNSTIGNGVEYSKNHTNSCYNYQGSKTTGCDLASNTKEIDYNSTYGVDNIWGKLYTWANSASACTNGYHVPTDAEWEILETTLNGGTNCRNATSGYLCDGLGWKDYKLKTSSNNIIKALKLPLSGEQLTDGSTFYNRGREAYLWSSTILDGTKSYARFFYWGRSDTHRNGHPNNKSFSVRCIKD